MRLTIPRAILLSAFMISLAIFFRLDDAQVVSDANAEVAGMDSYDLKWDYDFKRAVEMVVEECSFEIDINC